MICKRISYKNFRNIENEELELSPGVNVIRGENAQGKSNMLEGLYFFARGRSFRASKDKELIRFGENEAQLSIDYSRDESSLTSTLTASIPSQGKKLITRNGARLSSLKEMIGSFRAVLFAPSHLTLVDGGPSLRRSFMDIALSQLYPAYLDSLAQYNRALGQRTALLKEAASGKRIDSYMWEIYADQLAASGARIAARRWEYLSGLSESVSQFFSEMTSGRETPSLVYKSDAVSEGMTYEEIVAEGSKILFEQIILSLEKDIKYGINSHGIHRDDISIRLNSKDARLYASQGQRRSLALSMKLSEGEMAKRICGEYPVFLLDDVLSELDAGRRSFILGCLNQRQIVVTSCEDEHFDRDGVKFITVKDGRII
ncbi:MAG: DNA replication/repair protein RecF [Clostridia bacterium]|nr:DNA replication/repair protein RecF [Clostridia bacterium]